MLKQQKQLFYKLFIVYIFTYHTKGFVRQQVLHKIRIFLRACPIVVPPQGQAVRYIFYSATLHKRMPLPSFTQNHNKPQYSL
jgi:hypothetical protein